MRLGQKTGDMAEGDEGKKTHLNPGGQKMKKPEIVPQQSA